MKSYEEVTKDVLERSEEIIKNKYRRHRRLMAAASTSATCLVLAGALGAGIWLGSHQEGSIPSDTGSEITQSVSASEATEKTVTTEAAAVPAADPFEVLGFVTDENPNHTVKLSEWKKTEDFDRYRDYFFGTWEGKFSYLTDEKYQQLIIDDSEKSYLAKNNGCWFDGFYEVNDHVLAFVYGSLEGYSLHWIDVNAPSLMYVANDKIQPAEDTNSESEESAADKDVLVFSDSENNSQVYALTKTNIVPGEPQNGFLSIFKLYEKAKTCGIDIDLLTSLHFGDYDNEPLCSHDLRENCYPIYLISESSDRLEFLTLLSNRFASGGTFEEMGARFVLEKIGGEWIRTSAFFCASGDIPSEYHVFEEYAKDYCLHTSVNTDEKDNLDSDAAPENGTVYISKALKEAMDFYGDTFNDGCPVHYNINFKYYKDGKIVIPNQSLFDSEMDRLENLKQMAYDEEGNHIGGHFSFGYHGSNWGETKEYHFRGFLIKSQLEEFTAGSEYGIALFLDNQECETYSFSPPDYPDEQPSQTPTRAPFSHYTYKAGDSYTLEAPAENGQIRIAEALTEAIDHYGRYYCEGVESQFCVVIEYYSNGQRINPDAEFFEKEKARLTKLCGTDEFIHAPATEEPTLRDFDFLWADLTVSQMNKITANETFGCVIYLIGDYQRSY